MPGSGRRPPHQKRTYAKADICTAARFSYSITSSARARALAEVDSLLRATLSGLGSGVETDRHRWRGNHRLRCARHILCLLRFLIEQARTVLFPKLVDVIEQPANKFFIPNIAVTVDDGRRRASDQKRA